jgi:hypothetical protein
MLLLLLLLLLLCSASVCLSHQLVLCAAAAASFLGSGVEGLTDSSLQQLTNLKYLTHLKVEAEQTPAVSLSALSTISRLTSLRQLHWCSKDSLAGPLDIDCLTVQLCALTGNAWHVSVPGLICCQHVAVFLLAAEPSRSRASFKWLSWGAAQLGCKRLPSVHDAFVHAWSRLLCLRGSSTQLLRAMNSPISGYAWLACA